MSRPDPHLPPRIIHLHGGLRAVDDRTNPCVVQVDAGTPLVRFPTPEYAHLYRELSGRGLPPLGAEFLKAGRLSDRSAPDWQCGSPRGGFRVKAERLAWANIRHAALRDGNVGVADAASRCKTYLDLLSIRLLQLSDAYNRTLREWDVGRLKGSDYFDNSYVRYIDAAVHAFVSDAGALRDLIAESTWRFVLKQSGEVTTLATFLKKAKPDLHPVAASIVVAGQPGGWLKILTDLRNNVVHVAPVGRSQTFHFCQVREIAVSQDITVPLVHYPLLGADGAVWKEDATDIDWNDEATIKAALERYRHFFGASIDALDYAWRTISHLAELLRDMRVAANLRAEMPHITDTDIIGDVTFE